MRTNIVIDDKRVADVMAIGGFKTKRPKAYAALSAARGTLQWDDSGEAWAHYRADKSTLSQAMTLHKSTP